MLKKISASKWKHVQNALSNASHNRLTEEGLRIDPARELAGLNRGTDNILRTNGFTKQRITYPEDARAFVRNDGGYAITYKDRDVSWRLPYVKPYSNTVLYVSAKDAKYPTFQETVSGMKSPESYSGRQPTLDDWIDALSLRHEAIESSEFTKAFNKYTRARAEFDKKWKFDDASRTWRWIGKGKDRVFPKRGPYLIDGYRPYTHPNENPAIKQNPFGPDPGTVVGTHRSPGVLAKETSVLGLLQNNSVGNITKRERIRSGESKLLAQKAGLKNPTSADVYKLPITKRLYNQLSKYNNDVIERISARVIEPNDGKPPRTLPVKTLWERVPE